MAQAAAKAGYVPRTWDVAQGVADIAGELQAFGSTDPVDTLSNIRDRARGKAEGIEFEDIKRGVWIMRDLPVWLDGPAMASCTRMVRNLVRLLPSVPRENAQALIILTPSDRVPLELQGHATIIDWPLPDREEIGAMLDRAVEPYTNEQIEKPSNGTRDAAIDAAIGLSGEETQGCFARSIVQFRKIDAAAVAREKKRVVAKEKVIEWFDPLPGGLDAVGGLDVLKAWLCARRSAYSAKARAYGLPAPRGALLVGISGCGKSLTAKAIATAWNVPLLRLDLGALKSKYVGESEGNLRKAIKTIETVGRCVVWLDEIEKALQGATSGSADGGVSTDALGAILSWMQERSGEAFVIATANDVRALPPELMRKGRFDEIFFVDLPNALERGAILAAALAAHGRDTSGVALSEVCSATDGFTGSEIAALVPEAMFVAFADGERELTTDDLLAAARNVVPLVKTMPEKIEALRQWAKGRARPATSPQIAQVVAARTDALRVVDL